LSRKATCNIPIDREFPKELQKELNEIQVDFWNGNSTKSLGAITDLNINLKDDIINRQREDAFLA
jgi:hypothetical protein